MAKARYKKTKQCIHGIDRKETCHFCEGSGSYLKQAIGRLNSIYAKRGGVSFEAAFALDAEFKRWLKVMKLKTPAKDASIDWYLDDLKERGRLSQEKKSNFKLSYNVAKFFPGLENISHRMLSFGCYRVIANANITPTQKDVFRKEAEENNYNIATIYEELERRYNIGRIKRISDTITYTGREQFIKQVRKFLNRGKKEITKGVKVSLVAKVDKRKTAFKPASPYSLRKFL
jgi:hypothetical protein